MLFCHLVLSFATCYFISYSLLVLSLVLFLKFPSLPGTTGSSQNSTQEQFPHWLAEQLTMQSKSTHRGDLLRYTKHKASAASTLACKATHKRARATSTLACKATHKSCRRSEWHTITLRGAILGTLQRCGERHLRHYNVAGSDTHCGERHLPHYNAAGSDT
jgi:hypothetical protein